MGPKDGGTTPVTPETSHPHPPSCPDGDGRGGIPGPWLRNGDRRPSGRDGKGRVGPNVGSGPSETAHWTSRTFSDPPDRDRKSGRTRGPGEALTHLNRWDLRLGTRVRCDPLLRHICPPDKTESRGVTRPGPVRGGEEARDVRGGYTPPRDPPVSGLVVLVVGVTGSWTD